MRAKAHIALLMRDWRVASQRQQGWAFFLFCFLFFAYFYTVEKEAHYSKKINKKKHQQNLLKNIFCWAERVGSTSVKKNCWFHLQFKVTRTVFSV